MSTSDPRVIELVHSLPGRTRLRLPWLRKEPDTASALADHLADLTGMLEVRVRPRTGSVLCHYQHPLDEQRLIRAVRRHTHVAALVRPGDDRTHLRPSAPVPPARSSVARALAKSAADLDRQVLEFTDGHLDLATLAAVGFVTGGAAEIAFTRHLPVPTWFTLAWWAFRTFMQFEQDAVNGAAAVPAAVPAHPSGRPAAQPQPLQRKRRPRPRGAR